MKHNMKGIMTMAVLAVFGLSSIAVAGWGGGYGHMMGPGGQQGNGYYGNLSAEEIAKLEQQRADYFNATEGLRQQLYEKENALQSEMAKVNPDTSMASKLQGEISRLQSDLDQKELDYEIQTRKSVPNYNRGHRGYGPMMGYGPRGGGANCRW